LQVWSSAKNWLSRSFNVPAQDYGQIVTLENPPVELQALTAPVSDSLIVEFTHAYSEVQAHRGE
jgi:hypothetical protein